MDKGAESGRELPAGRYSGGRLQEGDWWRTGGVTVTEAQVVAFAGLSGDFFDVHMDDEFARDVGFPGRIAHGLLGLALIDGLKNRAPVQLDAVASLGWNWAFRAPVLPGDRIAATVAVKSARASSNPGRSVVVLAIRAENGRGEVVQEGTTTLLMRT